MEIILYTGNCSGNNNFLLSDNDEGIYAADSVQNYFGYETVLNVEDKNVDFISSEICMCIAEFYLKETVLAKIYEDYPCIDALDAGKVLVEIFTHFSTGRVCETIKNILISNHRLNVESFILFNIKYIMLTIYSAADYCCEKYLQNKQKEAFKRLLQTYFTLHKHSESNIQSDSSFDFHYDK